jgi:hypothetical protein
LLAVLLLLAALAPAPVLASDWKTVVESGDLRVQRRPYPGSALQEIRGVTRIEASLNEPEKALTMVNVFSRSTLAAPPSAQDTAWGRAFIALVASTKCGLSVGTQPQRKRMPGTAQTEPPGRTLRRLPHSASERA